MDLENFINIIADIWEVRSFHGKNESGKTTLRKFMIARCLGWRNQEDLLQDMMISPDISQ